MATSIVKLSKSFLVKVLVGIIILPFLFWGMGDVFRGGNQNVIATIDSEKISTQEFVKHLNSLNLNNEQIKNLNKTNLMDKILSEFIGRKVMALEIQRLGITVNDNSLRNIIKNEKMFFKDKKFSRTEYEKFLLKSGMTAPSFEQNMAKQESRRQFLDSISGGMSIPDVLIEIAYKKENQIKEIKYIDLNEYHSLKKPSKNEIQQIYEKNEKLFIKETKSLRFAEILPNIISGNKEYNESFFKKLDSIENKVLDGQSFEQTVNNNNLNIINVENIDKDKKGANNKTVTNISDKLFKEIYKINDEKIPEIIKIDTKFFLAEVMSIKKNKRSINDPDVQKFIIGQLNFKNKIDNNSSLIKDISMGGFNETKMQEFANTHKLELKNYKISSLKQNDIFIEEIIKRIFLLKDGQIDLITDSTLSKNFLILSKKTQYNKLKKDSNEFEQYKAKARLDLINKIYKTFDENLNQRYKVELNKKAIDRVKNSL
tara:strand:- start:1787 stop:3241 length:1455 start_codon:yes stop_codon:yes gene_type:complete